MKIQFYNSLAKIFPEEVKGCLCKRGSVLKDEIFHFAFCLKNEESYPLRNHCVLIRSDLEKFCRCYRAGYVPALYTDRTYGDDYTIYGKSGLYPDPLFACNTEEQIFSPGVNAGFVVEVGGTGEPLPVGEHKIEISVADGGGKRVCSDIFVLKIIDERLAENDLLITEWIHFDCIAEQHGCEMFSENFYKACGEYFRTAVKYGQTMILTPLFTFPLDTEIGGERLTFQTVGVKADGGKYFFDFSELKKFIDFAFGCGFKYIEFSHLFTQWGAMHAPKVMASVDGAYRRLFGWDTDSAGEEYVGFLEAFLPKLAEFVEQNGLKGKCFIHLSDEPSADAMPRYRMLKDIVKKNLGGVPVMDALSEYDFCAQGAVDLPAVAMDHTEKFIANKTAFLAYYCNCQCKDYLTNRFLDMPSQRNRILGFQLYGMEAKGFLHWGFNFYNSALSSFTIDPYRVTDAGGCFPAGDSFIVYPSETGCNPSLRLLVFHEGIQDYLALKRIESLKGKEFARNLLKEEGIDGVSFYPRSDERHIAFREKLNSILEKA